MIIRVETRDVQTNDSLTFQINSRYPQTVYLLHKAETIAIPTDAIRNVIDILGVARP